MFKTTCFYIFGNVRQTKINGNSDPAAFAHKLDERFCLADLYEFTM
uniref:Bm689 n=1 Tax=Brugia malayi TaxID=6279 RepID=A0A1I9G4V1_BRUMA|nr:Bm689 [Brugia malayi]